MKTKLMKGKNALFYHSILLVPDRHQSYEFHTFPVCSVCIIQSDSAAFNNVV